MVATTVQSVLGLAFEGKVAARGDAPSGGARGLALAENRDIGGLG
jgi:hypothetical protein